MGRVPSIRAGLAALVLGAALLVASASAGASPGGKAPASSTGRLIVMVVDPNELGRGGVDDPLTAAGQRRARARIASVLKQHGLRAHRSVPGVGMVAVTPRRGDDVAGLARRLREQAGVVSVNPERRLALRRTPNDPAFRVADQNAPNGTYAQWNIVRQRFERAWDYSRGRRVKVAVIDTGADAANRDLASRIVHAVDQVASGSPRKDPDGHGTHVSGLACGAADNGYGIAGAGFRCDLVIEKAAVSGTLDEATVVASIQDAVRKGARVINMSFGDSDTSADSDAIRAAINAAWASDVVMVAAALNQHVEGSQGYPAKYLQPAGTGADIRSGKGLVVTGAYYNGQNAGTGYGSGISLAAYGFSTSDGPGVLSDLPPPQVGVDCLTGDPNFCTPAERCPCRPGSEDHLGYLQGTSMAAPQVAGAAALIRAYRPNLSAKKVIYTVKRHASRDGRWSNQLGWGILDAGAALKALAPRGCIFEWGKRHRRWHRGHPHPRKTVHKRWHRRHPSCTAVR